MTDAPKVEGIPKIQVDAFEKEPKDDYKGIKVQHSKSMFFKKGDVSRPHTAGSIVSLYALQSMGTLKGPIIAQTLVMYVFFIFVVLSAEVLNWAPNIRIVAFMPYAVVCITTLELCRLFDFNATLAVLIPFYSTLIPEAIICFLSREAHILVSLLFFCSSLIIYLQSGLPSIQFHCMVWIMMYVLVYSGTVIVMLLFYRDATGESFSHGRVLDPPLQWGQEITFIICLALLGIAFLLLEKFIKLYANTLVERSKQVETLEIEKEELAKQILKYKEEHENVIDLDAPIQKVITILQSISAEVADSEVKNQLGSVIKVLGSDKLYSPNLNFEDKPAVDTEVSSWLHAMLTSTDGKKEVKQTGSDREIKKNNAKMTRFMPVLDSSVQRQVDVLLEKILDWDFNVFEVAELTNGRPLFFTSLALFTKHDLIRKFNIDEAKLRKFLSVIEDGYDARNPYHNSIHAADVVQTLNYFITTGGLDRYATELDIFASLVAAIIHDYEHPGLNNAFHINTQSELAIRYNDKSVLESYHCASAFSVLYEDSCNIFSGLSDGQKKEVRESIVTMVLATDMAQHFDLLGKFKSKLSGNGFDAQDRKDRLLLMQIGIKCADISNPVKPSHLCNHWASRVMEEFYRQGDEERRIGMPVSAFMDRQKPAEAKCQLGFIDFIVGPLFEVWVSFLPAMVHTIEILEQNRSNWKKNLASESLVLDSPSSSEK